MNFNCYNYNVLILYASVFVSGDGYIVYVYGDIDYVPKIGGNTLYFHPTKPPNDRRFFGMSFPYSSYKNKQYDKVLLTSEVVNDNFALSIISHPHLNKQQKYRFAFAPS